MTRLAQVGRTGEQDHRTIPLDHERLEEAIAEGVVAGQPVHALLREEQDRVELFFLHLGREPRQAGRIFFFGEMKRHLKPPVWKSLISAARNQAPACASFGDRRRSGLRPHRCRCRDFPQSAGLGQPPDRQSGKVEHGMAVAARRREKRRIACLSGDEAGYEFGADLVVAPADRRSEAGDDALAAGTERDHSLDGAFEHATERALPSGMGGTDHACFRIGEKDRAAIGGENAEDDAGRCRHQRIGIRPRAVVTGVDDDRVRRMDLVHRGKPSWLGAEPTGDPGSVLADPFPLVVRAEPTFKPR